jgi:hypothetical protein
MALLLSFGEPYEVDEVCYKEARNSILNLSLFVFVSFTKVKIPSIHDGPQQDFPVDLFLSTHRLAIPANA